MKVILLTTTVWSETSLSLLQRLTTSIGQKSNQHLHCHHVMLLQKSPDGTAPELNPSPHHQIDMLTCPDMISLSEARNRMLTHCLQHQLIGPQDVLAFPDDDCWYPENSLSLVVSAFTDNSDLEFFFCKYKNNGHLQVDKIAPTKPATATEIVSNASSNTIFLKGSLALKIGGFDRNLGVGAPNNGGEDLDYAIKAFLQASLSCFLPLYLIGHRDKDNSLRGKYFRGSALALRRYFHKRNGLIYEFIRKMLIGVVLVARQEMHPRELLIAAKGIQTNSSLEQS